jgi:hypothetical protein
VTSPVIYCVVIAVDSANALFTRKLFYRPADNTECLACILHSSPKFAKRHALLKRQNMHSNLQINPIKLNALDYVQTSFGEPQAFADISDWSGTAVFPSHSEPVGIMFPSAIRVKCALDWHVFVYIMLGLASLAFPHLVPGDHLPSFWGQSSEN